MPSPLSIDLRKRVVAAIAEGASCHEAAARFGISVSSASRWSKLHRQEGQVAPKPSGGDRVSHRTEAHADLILEIYWARPEIYLYELRDALAKRGVRISTSSLWRFFERHEIDRYQVVYKAYGSLASREYRSSYNSVRSVAIRRFGRPTPLV